MATIWKKLQNPFALVGQGFVLGGVLFFTMSGGADARPFATAPIEAAR